MSFTSEFEPCFGCKSPMACRNTAMCTAEQDAVRDMVRRSPISDARQSLRDTIELNMVHITKFLREGHTLSVVLRGDEFQATVGRNHGMGDSVTAALRRLDRFLGKQIANEAYGAAWKPRSET